MSEPREYAVVYSAHGSRYRFDGDPDIPPAELLTKQEADKAAVDWECTADTVGGGAIVIHVPSWNGDLSAWPFCRKYKSVADRPPLDTVGVGGLVT